MSGKLWMFVTLLMLFAVIDMSYGLRCYEHGKGGNVTMVTCNAGQMSCSTTGVRPAEMTRQCTTHDKEECTGEGDQKTCFCLTDLCNNPNSSATTVTIGFGLVLLLLFVNI